MGFFQKLKDKLGIGGVKISVDLSPGINEAEPITKGQVHFTSKSDKTVTKIKFKIIEEFTTGRGDDKKMKEYNLGSLEINESFELKSGDNKTVDFSVPFVLRKSNAQELSEKGGALGALGKMSKFASNEEAKYFLLVDVDVKDVFLGPNKKLEFSIA